jgi:hypothetical protein
MMRRTDDGKGGRTKKPGEAFPTPVVAVCECLLIPV